MKYIRTKDRIYKVLIKDQIKKCILVEANHNNQYYLLKKDIISSADTIEELCDEFVLVDETLPPHLDRDLKEIKMYKTYIAGSRGDVYGAIWTDKGLIYVAKINENGELVLI